MRFTAGMLTPLVLYLSGVGQLYADSTPTVAVLYDIEPQPLADALSVWRRQSGVNAVWDVSAQGARKAPRVTGVLLPQVALSQLLVGTGLTYRFIDPTLVDIGPETDEAIATGTGRKSAGGSDASGARRSDDLVGDPAEEVVVTGTHIRGIPPAGSVVNVFDREDIDRSGHTTVEQFLQAVPYNFRSGDHGESADARLSPGSGASGNVAFASGMNLRGLGSTATLVLLNGHRIAPSGQGTITDISEVPIAAISRIEILPDGASAIYGADAIAGVVNIRLIEDWDGANTSASYGTTVPSGLQRIKISHVMGSTWKDGNLLMIANSLRQTQLGADERSVTANVSRHESIFPSDQQFGLRFVGRHAFSDAVSLQADAEYGRTDRRALGATEGGRLELPANMQRRNVFTRLNFDGIEAWNIALKAHVSQVSTDFSYFLFPEGSPTLATDRSQIQRLVHDQRGAAIAANDTLAELPAGPVDVAVGAEHREERYAHRLLSPTEDYEDAARTVHSAYVELHLPLVAGPNATPGVAMMSVSVAGRYDDYSDVGSVKNPKFGLSWTPVAGLEFRSTYSGSYRAPAAGAELLSSSKGTSPKVQIYSFRALEGSMTPVALISGATHLRPERARHWTAGVCVSRLGMEGLRLAVNYYDIAYRDRIISPRLDPDALRNPALQSFIRPYESAGQLQAALERERPGLMYEDRTGPEFQGGAFGPDPQNLATHVFDARLTNAGIVRTNGFDFAINYSKLLATARWESALSANYIRQIETALTSDAPVFDVVGTLGNPARLRAKANTQFSRGNWNSALTVNFTEGYAGTVSTAHRRVDSYVTVDTHVRYSIPNANARLLDGLSIALSVSNLLNERPPHISGSLATRGATYDAVNADPLGRMISIQMSKDW